MKRIHWCVLIAVIILFIGLDGQQQKEKRQALQYEAAAIVKLVPIRVLDANGRPVKGLKKEDFILYDDDELKTITEFEVHESGIMATAAADPSAEVQPQTNRKYFILLDIQGSDPNGMANAKEAALEFLQTKIKPGDEVGILSFAPMTGLTIQQYLTSDPDKIEKGIKRAKEVPPTPGFISGESLDKEERESIAKNMGGSEGGKGMTRIEDATGAGASSSAFSGSRAIGVQGLRAHSRTSADFKLSMSDLANAMKYIPGSKNVVYFSSREPGKKVARQFAEANAPVYAVNTKDWITQGVYTKVKKKHIFEEHPLKDFAEASGGHYFADIHEIETIAEDIDQLSGNYYVLGYYIDEKWDGRFHRIRVEVKKPGLRVHSQDGYYNPKPFAELTDIEKRLHLYDLAFADKPVTPFLDLQTEALYCSGVKKANFAVLTKLDVDERTGIPPGKAEIFIFVFDEDHNIVLGETGELDLSTYDKETLYSYLLKEMDPGNYECRIVVRDTEMGRSLIGNCSLVIPETSTKKIELCSPLLLIPDKEAEFIKLSREKEKDEKATSLIRFYPFLPQNTSPLMGNLGPGINSIWAMLPIIFKDQSSEEIGLDMEMIEETSGDKIAVDWQFIDSNRVEQSRDFILIGIDLQGLEAGLYRLEFTVVDEDTGERASISIPLNKR